MICPKCRNDSLRVTNVQKFDDVIRRRKVCQDPSCQHRIFTVEMSEDFAELLDEERERLTRLSMVLLANSDVDRLALERIDGSLHTLLTTAHEAVLRTQSTIEILARQRETLDELHRRADERTDFVKGWQQTLPSPVRKVGRPKTTKAKPEPEVKPTHEPKEVPDHASQLEETPSSSSNLDWVQQQLRDAARNARREREEAE